MIAAVTVLLIGRGLYLSWQHRAAYPSSDDSCLQGGIIKVAPLTSGTIETVTVAENQRVQASDVLFTVNTNSLKAAVQTAEAQLDQTRAALDEATAAGAAVLPQQIVQQAQMLAFQDVFLLTGWAAFAMLSVVVFMQRPKSGTAA